MKSPIAIGHFTGRGGPKRVPCRLTLSSDGLDYECRWPRTRVHKAQRHLIECGVTFTISRSGTLHIVRIPPFGPADAKRVADIRALFESS